MATTHPVIDAYRYLLALTDRRYNFKLNKLPGIDLEGDATATGRDFFHLFSVTLPNADKNSDQKVDVTAMLRVVSIDKTGQTPSLYLHITMMWNGPRGLHTTEATYLIDELNLQRLATTGYTKEAARQQAQNITVSSVLADPDYDFDIPDDAIDADKQIEEAAHYNASWEHHLPEGYDLDDTRFHALVVDTAADHAQSELLSMILNFGTENFQYALQSNYMVGIVDPQDLVNLHNWIKVHQKEVVTTS